MTYRYSEKTIQGSEQRVLVSLLIIFLVNWLVMGLMARQMVIQGCSPSPWGVITMALILSALIILLSIFTRRPARKQLESFELELGNKELTFRVKDRSETVPYDSITQLTLYSSPISVSFRIGMRRYNFSGYEDMETIASTFERKVEGRLVEYKKHIFDIYRVPVFALAFSVFVLFYISTYLFSWTAQDRFLFRAVTFIGLGLYFIFFRAVNLRPKHSNWAGGMLIALGVLLLAFALFLIWR
jgi:peptidoglycan/LPS O-acetylase OafA/YrhL